MLFRCEAWQHPVRVQKGVLRDYKGKGRAQRGYTLTELAVAVALSGMVVGGAVFYGNQLLNQAYVEVFGDGVARLVGSVEDLYVGKRTYNNLSLSTAIQLQLFKDARVYGVNQAAGTVSAYLGSRDVGVSLGVPNKLNGSAWGVHYTGLPGHSCFTLVQYAMAVGDVVAVVADSAKASNFSSWGSGVNFDDKSLVTGFPSGYVVIKNRSAVGGGAGAVNACSVVNNVGQALFNTNPEYYGLVVMRLQQ